MHWTLLYPKATELLLYNSGKWIMLSNQRVYKCIWLKYLFPLIYLLLTCSKTNGPRNTLWGKNHHRKLHSFFNVAYNIHFSTDPNAMAITCGVYLIFLSLWQPYLRCVFLYLAKMDSITIIFVSIFLWTWHLFMHMSLCI